MSKYALEQVPPLTLLVVQLVVSVVLLWVVVVGQGVRVPLNRDTLRLALIGVLNPGLAYTFSLLGLAQTTASMSALLWAAEPILIIGFAWLILCERLTWPLLACAALAIVGVSVVAGLDLQSGANSSLLGDLLIVAGVCCALYTVLARRMAAHLAPLLIVALQQTAALLWALLIWPAELLREITRLATIPLSLWAWGPRVAWSIMRWRSGCI